MIRKFHEAKLAGATDPVTLWGSGAPRREFMHVDDMASAAVYLVRQGCTGIYNIGTGKDLSILEAACWIANIVCPGLEEIAWDRSRLDGVARKLLNVSKLHAAGWNNCRSFDEGIRQTYKAYKSTL
jgi:GDP-L-fucose synthase